MCYLVPFIELSVSHTSVLTILAITVERYYAICLPLQVRKRGGWHFPENKQFFYRSHLAEKNKVAFTRKCFL